MITTAKIVRFAALFALAFTVQFAVVANAQMDRDNPILPINTLPTVTVTAPPRLPTVTVTPEPDPDNGTLAFLTGRPDRGPGEHGSGGGFNGNRGDNQDVKDASKGDGPCPGSDSGSNPSHSNPIVLSTGDKVEPETDFVSAGEMPLSLQRTYNHYWNYPGLFGRYWVSSFDYTVVWQTVGTDIEGVIFAQRPDGRRIKFIHAGTTNRWNEDKANPVAYIIKNAGSPASWSMFAEDDVTEQYDGGGRALNITNSHGIGWTFTYAGNYLTRVTHTSGRFIQFS